VAHARALRAGSLVAALGLAACGEVLPPPEGLPLPAADTLFVVAHFDDDLIFMQPDVIAALEAGSVTTVYVTSGDPVYGNGRRARNLGAAQIAYASVLGSEAIDCGYVRVNGAAVEHCRWTDRPMSMISIDIPDGGIPGEYDDSPLHLVEQKVTSVPVMGPAGGRLTLDGVIGSLAELITMTRPREIHALDLGAKYGYDHSSHVFSSAFTFWGAARAGYAEAIRWHRGYNVDGTPITLTGDDLDASSTMLAYFDACYFACAPCGTPCAAPIKSHADWLARQYSHARSPIDALDTLALAAADGLCAVASGAGAGLVLGDCAAAPRLGLAATGHLRLGDACVASAPGNDDPVVLAPCADDPAQYWLADSDGQLWNGRPPQPVANMAYDHVRCLNAEPMAGAVVGAPICGEHLTTRWRFGPIPTAATD
jgi:hypothetical protein